MMSDENDISETSKSANLSWRQNSSEGCTLLGTRSMPSAFTRPSKIGQVRGLEVRPMPSWRFMEKCQTPDARSQSSVVSRESSLLVGRLGAVQHPQQRLPFGALGLVGQGLELRRGLRRD